MEQPEVIKLALSQGLWAVLFVILLFYVLRTQETRDKKNQEREDKLLAALEKAQANNQQFAVAVQNLADDVDEIKDELKRR